MARILIIEARFYTDIADALFEGAETVLKKAGHDVTRIAVPGALEIPAAIAMATKSSAYDGYVALGCVIRGETYHFEIVCNESARGLTELAITHQLAIGNGILTVENREQAWVRADPTQSNKGRAAAEACLAMLTLKEKFND